tara:strand:- start:6448 stop:6759 length:312 start_codon:yes stop_codon:yes gene_type:complete
MFSIPNPIPVPNKDISLHNWIETLKPIQILSLLSLCDEKNDDVPEIFNQIKELLQKSNTIKLYYDEQLKRTREQALFYDNYTQDTRINKRPRFTPLDILNADN